MTDKKTHFAFLGKQKERQFQSRLSKFYASFNQSNIPILQKIQFSLSKKIDHKYKKSVEQRRSFQINIKDIKDCKGYQVIKKIHRQMGQQNRIEGYQLNTPNYNISHKRRSQPSKTPLERISGTSITATNSSEFLQEENDEQATIIGLIKLTKKPLAYSNTKKDSIQKKSSFIDLINKYRFQNLKVNVDSQPNKVCLMSTSGSIQYQENNSTENINCEKKPLVKDKSSELRQSKITNSLLSPWRTIHQPINQLPFI